MSESGGIVARDLAVNGVRILNGERPVRDAFDELIALRSEPGEPNVVVIVDAEGLYEGLLTARLLLRSLLALWRPTRSIREDVERFDEELLELARERCVLPVRTVLVRGLPTAAPDDRLPTLIELACEERMEFLPVVEDRRLSGVVPIGRLFHTVASLALTPGDEGIHLK